MVQRLLASQLPYQFDSGSAPEVELARRLTFHGVVVSYPPRPTHHPAEQEAQSTSRTTCDPPHHDQPRRRMTTPTPVALFADPAPAQRLERRPLH